MIKTALFTEQEDEAQIDWNTVPEIPDYVPYLLIGGGFASLEAFKAIKTAEPRAAVSWVWLFVRLTLL